jgi:hypothetical protein
MWKRCWHWRRDIAVIRPYLLTPYYRKSFNPCGMWHCVTEWVVLSVWRITGPSSLGSKKNTGREIGWLTIFLWLLNSEDEGTVVLWNVDNYLLNKTVSHPRRTEPLTTPISESQSSLSTDIEPKYNRMYPFCCPEHSIWEVTNLNIEIKFTKSYKL